MRTILRILWALPASTPCKGLDDNAAHLHQYMLELGRIADTDEEDGKDTTLPPHLQAGKKSGQQSMAAHGIVKDIGWSLLCILVQPGTI